MKTFLWTQSTVVILYCVTLHSKDVWPCQTSNLIGLSEGGGGQFDWSRINGGQCPSQNGRAYYGYL